MKRPRRSQKSRGVILREVRSKFFQNRTYFFFSLPSHPPSFSLKLVAITPHQHLPVRNPAEDSMEVVPMVEVYYPYPSHVEKYVPSSQNSGAPGGLKHSRMRMKAGTPWQRSVYIARYQHPAASLSMSLTLFSHTPPSLTTHSPVLGVSSRW